MGVGLYADGSSTAAITPSGSSNGIGVLDSTLSAVSSFINVQTKFSGDFTTFRLYDYEIDYLDYPQLTYGQIAYSNFGGMDEKVLSGVQMRVCTLGVERSFTVLLDRAVAGTFTLTTNADDPTEYTHQFTAPTTATEAAILVDGNIELYEWKPFVLYGLPHAQQIWDSGYIDFGTAQHIWVRHLRVKALSASGFNITPYFDGVADPPVSVPGGHQIFEVSLGREAKGRQPRFVFDSGNGGRMKIFWFEITYRRSGGQTEKKIIQVAA